MNGVCGGHGLIPVDWVVGWNDDLMAARGVNDVDEDVAGTTGAAAFKLWKKASLSLTDDMWRIKNKTKG